MPYIREERRVGALKPYVPPMEGPGELNYMLTWIIGQYLKNAGGISYQNLNEIIGVLECVKQELYRRIVTLYEDRKRAENGDVYPREIGGTA